MVVNVAHGGWFGFGKSTEGKFPNTEPIMKFLKKNRSKFFITEMGDVMTFFKRASTKLEQLKTTGNGNSNAQMSRSRAFVYVLPALIREIRDDCKSASSDGEKGAVRRRVENMIAAFSYLENHSHEYPSADQTLSDDIFVFKFMMEFGDSEDETTYKDDWEWTACEPAQKSKEPAPSQSFATGDLFRNLRALYAIGKSENWIDAGFDFPELLNQLKVQYCPKSDGVTLSNNFVPKFNQAMFQWSSTQLLNKKNWETVISWIRGGATAAPPKFE